MSTSIVGLHFRIVLKFLLGKGYFITQLCRCKRVNTKLDDTFFRYLYLKRLNAPNDIILALVYPFGHKHIEMTGKVVEFQQWVIFAASPLSNS